MLTRHALCAIGLAVVGCDAAPAPAAAPAGIAPPAAAPVVAQVPKPAPAQPAAARPTPAPAGGSAAPTAPKAEGHFHVGQQVQTTVDGPGQGPFRFTATWHTNWLANWARQLAPYKGKPGLRYLEVGVFEGRSLMWMFENVLTEASSSAVAIDVFMGDYEQNFDHNVQVGGAKSRITKITGPSQREMRGLELDSFDIIYIDGSHTMDDVLADGVLALPLLKNGGLLIFDDYGWSGRATDGWLPKELRPGPAIDAFVTANRNYLEVVHRGYQVFLRKRPNPCAVKDYCSEVGAYTYDWRAYELKQTASGALVLLTDQERNLVESLARSKQWGDTNFVVSDQLRAAPGFTELVARLGLKL